MPIARTSVANAPRVAIFRHNLFEPSETFIRAQAGALRRYDPFYVARREVHDAPAGVSAFAMKPRAARRTDIYYGLTARSRELTEILREERASVVHAHFGPDGLFASHSAGQADTPLVVTLHGRDVTVRAWELIRSARPVAVRYAVRRRALAQRADVLLCVSEEIRRSALAIGLPANKLRTHYIGVDTDVYREHDAARAPAIVHVARLVEKKGTVYLIEAFESVAREFPDVRLLIVGDGPLRRELEARARAGRAHARIEFLGAVSQERVRALVGESQVFALPSVTAANGDKEGLPIALIEAMSLGTAILATRHSGIPEAVTSPELGRLVPERDSTALANALRDLLSDHEAARQIGSAAAAHVRESFSLHKQTQILERIYDDVR